MCLLTIPVVSSQKQLPNHVRNGKIKSVESLLLKWEYISLRYGDDCFQIWSLSKLQRVKGCFHLWPYVDQDSSLSSN